MQRKKRKYDSFPACLDAAIPFHEQTAFWHRHYSCTAPRAVETPLTDVRTFYLPLPWLWPEDVREGEAESLLNIDARTVRRCPEATRSRRNAQPRCWFLCCIGEFHGLSSPRRSAEENYLPFSRTLLRGQYCLYPMPLRCAVQRCELSFIESLHDLMHWD